MHHNDGVPNKWFYLAAEGGSGVNANQVSYNVVGVGVDSMARVAYATWAGHLLPEDGFDEARAASVLAAGEVCGDFSQERISTEDAWWAVGVVGGGPPVVAPFVSPAPACRRRRAVEGEPRVGSVPSQP